MNFGPYSIKNLKSFRGMEGHGFNGTLYRDGVKVGLVIDHGDGGPAYLERSPEPGHQEESDRLNAYARSLPPEPSDFGDLAVTTDFFLASLLEDADRQARMKRACAKATLFCIKEEDGRLGDYKIAGAHTEKRSEILRQKYGERLVCIYNDDFTKAASKTPAATKSKKASMGM